MVGFRKSLRVLLTLIGVVLIFAGCGSQDDFVYGGYSAPVSAGDTTGDVRVNSVVLARAVPSQITELRFTGLDAEGQVQFGPDTRKKNQTILLESVPLTVTRLQIEYLAGSLLVGRGVSPVTIASGQTFVLDDPDFEIVFADEPLQLSPSATTIPVDSSQSYSAQAALTEGGTVDVSSFVDWSTEDSNLVSIDNQGTATGQGLGTTNVTATLTFGDFSISGTTPLTVAPALISLEVFPPNSFGTVGGEIQYRALGRFSDGSTQVFTDQVTWTVTNQGASADVTVSNSGLASIPSTASTGQKVVVTAEMNGVRDSADLTLNQFLYVVNLVPIPDRDLTMFARNPEDGSVTSLGTVASGPQPEGAIYSPDGRLIYIPYPFTGSFAMFTVGDDGIAVPNIDLATGNNLVSLDNGFVGVPTTLVGGAVDPLNRFLYVVDVNVGQINTFSIAPSGLVTLLRKSPTAGAENPDARRLIISADGRYMFVLTRGDELESYAILDDGNLEKISTVTTSSDSGEFAMTPDGTRIYVNNDSDDLIYGFNVSRDGVLSPISEIQTPSDEAREIACSNDRLYVRIRGTGLIAMYRIETDGTLSEIIDPLTTTNSIFAPALDLVIDKQGRFLYAAEPNSNTLLRFEIAADGLLVNRVDTVVPSAYEVLISP